MIVRPSLCAGGCWTHLQSHPARLGCQPKRQRPWDEAIHLLDWDPFPRAYAAKKYTVKPVRSFHSLCIAIARAWVLMGCSDAAAKQRKQACQSNPEHIGRNGGLDLQQAHLHQEPTRAHHKCAFDTAIGLTLVQVPLFVVCEFFETHSEYVHLNFTSKR